MDRSMEALDAAPRFSWLRVGMTMIAATAIIVIGSWMVRAYPNSGYRAGYDAANAKGPEWIRTEVDAAGGNATSVCRLLYSEAEQSALEPRYDYGTFVNGCGDAVDHLHGGLAASG